MENVNYRIGDIEFRSTRSWNGSFYYEVVMYYPNGYYGHEDDYVFDEMRQMYHYKDNEFCFIDPSCFKHEESCYTLARFEKNSDDEYDIRSIGSRPFEISPKDITDYVACVKYGFNYLKSLEKDEDYDY